MEFADTSLKAEFMPLLLDRSEVFNFNNSSFYFDVSEKESYYMQSEDKKTMLNNLSATFPAAFSLPLSAAYLTYPYWNWRGSCYGMAATVFLQHYGVIDLLEDYEDAECVRELENNQDIISAVNYYQYASAGSFLSENFALNKGDAIYSRQLRDMFEAVENGNIVLFSYYPNGILENSTGHTVLLTGAYTQPDGTHVLIQYDCNTPYDYNEYYSSRFYIDSSFTSIQSGYAEYDSKWDLGAFNWTDDYKHFEAFDINGKGNSDSLYTYFFAQLSKTLKMILNFVFNIVK